MKKLRIAILGRTFIKIPPTPKDVPQGYSGAAEMMISLLTEELVKRGHDVTLFASKDTKTSAKLEHIGLTATSQLKNIGPSVFSNGMKKFLNYEFALNSKAYRVANEKGFDIIHSHQDGHSAHFSPLSKVPSVMTFHSPIGDILPFLKFYNQSQSYIALSNAQRAQAPELNFAETIYHGFDVSKVPFVGKPDDYLVQVGRITPDKGSHLAVEVARKTGLKLYLVGMYTPAKEAYFKEQIAPFVDGKKIIHTGFVSQKEVFKIVSRAKALLLPVQVEEAFGLAMVEAMSAGTPVVAFKRGAIPEVVQHGKTGFVVKNVSEMIDAVKKIDQIRREDCRKHVEQNFSVEKMVDAHEEVYRKIISGSRKS